MNTHVNYHPFSPICFGAYWVIFRENFSVCSKILLRFVFAQACNFVCSYVRNHRRLEIKSTNDHAPTSFLNTSHLMRKFVGFFPPLCDIACKDLSECCLQEDRMLACEVDETHC